GLCATG
ncbi:hypothetical protein VCHENC02_2278B, partial [Vibrio harveyi]